MKILIVDTYYPAFLADYYRLGGDTAGSYEAQRSALHATCFGLANFYSRHLRALGIEAEELIANAAPLQLTWAREQGVKTIAGYLPPRWTGQAQLAKVLDATQALLPILAEQIRRARPDVLYVQDLSVLPPSLLRELKRDVKLIVGQSASPLPAPEYVAPYDLVVTSFPHYVPRLRERGLRAEYLRLAFEPGVLERVGPQHRRYPCTFVGGISAAHARGTAFLERIAESAGVECFGYGRESLPKASAIYRHHHGPVWALDMYRALAQSQLTLNRHIDVAEGYANNMRLYEATGMGAMLLTDEKTNLGELFEVGAEVATYRSTDEAIEMIKHYAAHPDERDRIAKAGQRRTLREHTYAARMVELVEILRRQLEVAR